MDETDVVLHLAEACHELRTPVAVLSLVTGIQDHVEELEPARLRRLIEAVERQCVELRVTIDRYLEHGELTFGGTRAQEVLVDVDRVVQEALDALVPLVPPERLDLDLEPTRIGGDPRRLSSIVTNLVVNAAKYSEPTSAIEVTLTSAAHSVTLEVADRGSGMSRESRRVLLEPFRRGVEEAVQRQQGTGLGLSIVVRHVQALRGVLEIHDRSGGGSVVTVTLPEE